MACKDNELELFVPITSNKNGRESNKNLKAMRGAIRPQFPLYDNKAMPFAKMKLNPPLKMGRSKFTIELWEPQKNLGPKAFYFFSIEPN